MKKSLLLTLLLAPSFLYASEAGGGSLELTVTPGGLASSLGEIPPGEAATLTLSGSADVRDFRALAASIPEGVRTLDLSGLSVEAYVFQRPQPDGRTCYDADELPAWSLFGLPADEILLPSSIKSIGEGALSASSVVRVAVPEGVVSVGDYAFYGCASLEEVSLPSTLTSLGKSAFAGCVTLTGISLEDTKLAHLSDCCFAEDAALTDISVPASLRSVGAEAFRNTGLRALSLPAVTEFDDFALAGMRNLEKVALSADADQGKGMLMGDVSLVSVGGVPDVVPALFAAGCSSLDAETVSGHASMVGAWAFAGTSASDLKFESLLQIGEGAFADISGLERVDVQQLGADIPDAPLEAFAGIDTGKVMLLVSDDSEESWRAHALWGTFNVVSVSQAGAPEMSGDSSDALSAWIDGDTLRLACEEGLSSIALYAADGRALHAETLSGVSADLDLSRFSSASASDACVIAVVKGGKNVKVIKMKMM